MTFLLSSDSLPNESGFMAQYCPMTEFDYDEFTKWLDIEMSQRKVVDRAELVRRARAKGHKLSESSLSKIYKRKSPPGPNVAVGIAAGLNIAAEIVLHKANLSTQKPKKDITPFQRRVLDMISENIETKEQQEGYIDLTESYIKGTRGANRGTASDSDEA